MSLRLFWFFLRFFSCSGVKVLDKNDSEVKRMFLKIIGYKYN